MVTYRRTVTVSTVTERPPESRQVLRLLAAELRVVETRLEMNFKLNFGTQPARAWAAGGHSATDVT